NADTFMVLLSLPPYVAAGERYPLDDSSNAFGAGVGLPGGSGAVYMTDASHAGAVTISAVDAAHVTGTFQFDAASPNGAVIHVTSGAFDAAIDTTLGGGGAGSLRTRVRAFASAH